MKKGFFYQFGYILHKARWLIVIAFTLAFAYCIPILPKVMSRFTDTSLIDPHSPSALVENYLDTHLNYYHNRFIIMYKSKHTFVKNGIFDTEIHHSLSGLKNFPYTHEIIYPDENKKQVSKDKHSAYALVMLEDNGPLSNEVLAKFKSSLKKVDSLEMLIGGEPLFQAEVQKQTQTDLIKAQSIATPIAVITLLIVFGSIAAALIPIILDGICAIFILTALYYWGHLFSLSVFTINIALLLGLCLSLDYALFIINRFREELAQGRSTVEALAITQGTAGKAVFFSGLAVLISLSALFLFPINILFSVGVGGVTAVAFAVLISTVLLPAILAILQNKINFLPIRFFSSRNGKNQSYWLWLVTKVITYRWSFFIGIMIVLLFLSYPILSIQFGLSDFHVLPKTLESRQVFDVLQEDFNDHELYPITVIVTAPHGKFLTEKNIGQLLAFTKKIKADPRVEDIFSIVTTSPQLTQQQYEKLYTSPKQYQSEAIKKLLLLTTEDGSTVLTITSKYAGESPESEQLVKELRDIKLDNGLKVNVSGISASTIDVMAKIYSIFPYALLWVLSLTYLILLILLRSLLIPLKAIIMNILSLTASYGVLVFIIQKGYLSSLLHFESQGMIDISLLIIIFCALFGFSMDYEVFLLARIKEFYEKTDNTNKAICSGIVHSSKIITSAAIVVILLCMAFLSADILMVKAFGLGIAVAIFVDAFLIRTILVPAIMAILQTGCWYLPKWLNRILPSLSFNPEDKHF